MPERNPTEWAQMLAEVYESKRKPGWRPFLPRGSMEKSQKCLWAIVFNSPQAAEFGKGDTSALMLHFLDGFGRWIEGLQGDARTTCWVLLDQYSQGSGTLASATPEAVIRAALKPMPKRSQLVLLLRLAQELA